MHFVTSSARLQSTGTLYTTPIPYLTNKGDTDRPNAHKKPILSITLYYTLFGADSYFILKNETSQPPVLIGIHTTDPAGPYLNAEAHRSGPTGFSDKACETMLSVFA